MNKLYLWFLLYLLVPGFAQGQFNYKPGYVVTLKGDTLRGFIDYKGWDLNPNAIKFKMSKKDKAKRLTVNDISYFSISNLARFERYIGPISMDNTNMDHMIEYRDTSYKIDTVFIEILQKGKNLTLYSYSDAIKTRFYIGERPDFAPLELVYRLYYDLDHVDYNANKGRTVNENTYMKQLFALATKYNAVTDDLMKNLSYYGYKEYYLTRVVKLINATADK
jgi:hypothetical protein